MLNEILLHLCPGEPIGVTHTFIIPGGDPYIERIEYVKGRDPMKGRDWKDDLFNVSLAIQQAERTLKAATREHKNTIRELKEDRDRILSAIESGQMELGDDVGGGE